MSKICCFIGHRNVKKTAKLREKLTDTVRWLITEKEVDQFLFGSKSNFDDFCQEVVKGLKEEYPHISSFAMRICSICRSRKGAALFYLRGFYALFNKRLVFKIYSS